MYFVYECYDRGVLLFRSIAKDGSRPNPIPFTSPELRAIQKQAQKKNLSLSYSFIAAGLSKSEAEKLLKQLNSDQEVRERPQSEDSSEMAPIYWHPECGQRLTERQFRPASEMTPIQS